MADEILLESPTQATRMLDLPRLISMVRSAESRRHTFEAIRQVADRFPSVAHDELEKILEDPEVADRPKVLLLYWLREFDKFGDLVSRHAPAFGPLLDAVFRDVEQAEEEGLDPLSAEDFPNG